MTTNRSERHPVDQLADEFVARYRRGERPSISDYARRYPDLAAELEELLTALMLMEEHGPAAESRACDDAGKLGASGRIPDRLGEYRILREIGRGGMGVVYEAVQESLGRHVALKVLPATPLTDSTRLKRFQREGQAAARLHHTNIVPVFGVGESDGVRYFAMQFIAAQSLDKVIDEVRQLRGTSGPRTPPIEGPTVDRRPAESSTAGLSTQSDSPRYYRSVAQLGEQIAEALAHAHRQGILHRDIKPSNLLLDARGTAWITDFGLATGEGMEELTNTGDVVGTLRYMAPERLQGKGDARADVYGLGLTLYELLTLRPAFDAPDRAALVRQIADANPTRPRKLDPRIPRDLETIVLKACAREPFRRYATADEVAEDLRRFLANRPIEARRTPRWEQAWRWCRRNPAIAVATSTAMAALIVGLGVSLWQWRRADDSARQAKENATQADNSRLQAETSASQAEKDFELALDAIEQMLERVGIDRLEALPHMDRTRRALLQDAVRFYQNLLRDREDHPKGRLAMARAYRRLGQIHNPLGDARQALESFDRALGLVNVLLQDAPDDVEVRRLEAAIYSGRGVASQFLLGRSTDAEADYRKALAVWDRVGAEQPEHSPSFAADRALTQWVLADLLRAAARLQEAESLSRQAVEVAEGLPAAHPHRSRLVANALNALGLVLDEKGETREGEKVFRKALPWFEKSANEYPEPYRRYELAVALRGLAQYEMRSPTTRLQAEKAYQRSLQLSERLVADFPDVLLYQDGLATTANGYGVLLSVLARPVEAERTFEQAVATWRNLVSRSPKWARNRVGLAGALHNLARERRERVDLAGARELFEEAIQHEEEAIRLKHREPNALVYLGNHYRDLVSLLLKLNQLQEAEKAIERQLAVARDLTGKDGEWPAVRVFQARAWENLSLLRQGGLQLDKAAQACSEAAGHRRRLTADFPDSPDYASELGGLLNHWAYILARQGRWTDVLSLVDEAIAAQETALWARPTHRQYQRHLVNHYYLRGDALIGLGDHASIPLAVETARARLPESFNDYSWAIPLAKSIPLAEKDPRLGPDEQVRLAGEYAEQAMVLLQAAQRKKSKAISGIHTHPAFAPLRDRPDFQKLLATVPKSGK